MRNIISRNAHQALAESCYQVHQFGVDNAMGGKTLPIPSSTLLVSPLERVALYPELDQFATLLTAARAMAENRLPHLGHSADALKRDPTVRATLHAGECDQLGVAHVQVDMDGKVQMLASCTDSDVALEYVDMVYLSMALEYIANVCGREPGALWITTLSPQFTSSAADAVASIAKSAPQPPAPYDDPYSSNSIHNTIPLMSIQRGRWDRELRQFFDGAFDQVDYVDPFIQRVLAPAHRAYNLRLDGAPEAQVQRACGEIASQDWMQACLLTTSTRTTSCTPPSE